MQCGRAGGDRRVPDDGGCCGRGLLGSRVEGKNDRVPGLQRDQTLEDRSGCRIGDGSDAADDADRLGDFDDAGDLVIADDADGLEVLHGMRDVLTNKDVLDGLVLENSAAGLGNCGHRQFAVLGQRGDDRLLHDERSICSWVTSL